MCSLSACNIFSCNHLPDGWVHLILCACSTHISGIVFFMRLFSTGTMNSRPSQSWHSFMKPSCASGVWLSKPKLAGADEGAGEELSIHCHSSSQYCSTGFKIYLDRRNVISLKTIFAVSSYAHGISDSIAII